MWFSVDGLMAGKEIEMRIFQLGNLLDCISILFQMPVSSRLLKYSEAVWRYAFKISFLFLIMKVFVFHNMQTPGG